MKEAVTASVESAIRYLEQKLPMSLALPAAKKGKPGQRAPEPRIGRSEAPRPVSQQTTEVLPPRPGSLRKPVVREPEPEPVIEESKPEKAKPAKAAPKAKTKATIPPKAKASPAPKAKAKPAKGKAKARRAA